MEPLRFVVLGDSVAYGVGAGRAGDALGPRLAEVLRSAGRRVELHVVAVPGARSADLALQVRRAALLAADLALIVVGANDLARMVPPERAAVELGTAVETLRRGRTAVVVATAPDMSCVPGLPPVLRGLIQGASADLQRRQAAAARAAGAMVADIGGELGRAFATEPVLFSADRFHPSSTGYARIATALTPHVLAATRHAAA